MLLSGEHRPAVDLARWEREVAASGADALVRADELPARLRFGWRDFETNQYLARSRHRWRLVPRPRSDVVHRAVGWATKLGRGLHPLLAIEYVHRRDAWLVGLRRRAGAMQGRRFWRGSQWLALDRRAADAVLHPDPAVRAWFEQSWIPDETYFQTLLRITPGLTVADRATTFVLDDARAPDAGLDAALARRPAGGVGVGRALLPQGRPQRASRGRRGDRRGRGPATAPRTGRGRSPPAD